MPPLGTFFFFNDTATTEIYTLSLHDALPISQIAVVGPLQIPRVLVLLDACRVRAQRSEEHTSELQSLAYLVCRLLLEKKKTEGQPLELRDKASGDESGIDWACRNPMGTPAVS